MKKAAPWIITIILVILYFLVPFHPNKTEWWKEIDNEQDLFTYLYEDHLDDLLTYINSHEDVNIFTEIVMDKWPGMFSEE